MTRTHGRCANGQRLVAKTPFGKWRTLTFLAALRCDGLTAPCVIDGPINGVIFRADVEQALVPPSNLATWWSWITSVATKAKVCAKRSEPQAPSSSSCPLTPRPQPNRTGVRQR